MPTIVKTITALVTSLFGVYAFAQPEPTAKASGFSLVGKAGKAELRTAFGGFFLGLGLAAILIGGDAYTMLGVAYLITFAVRLASVVLDGQEILRREFYIYGEFELISGALLVL